MAPLLTALLVPAALASAPGLDASLLPDASSSGSTAALQDDPTTPPAAGAEGETTKKGTGNRDYLMQVNARVRYLSVPDSLLDIGFFNSKDPGANESFDRPKLRGWAIGGEYVFDMEPANYVIYAEYVKSLMGEGYWDDVEEPADHNDGDWVRPDGLGAVVVGATYLHEVDAIPVDEDHKVGLSFLFGAGLGLTVVTGGLEVWHPGSNPDNLNPGCGASSPAYNRYDVCGSDGYKRIPKVLPMVDLSASARVNFANHFHIRIDGGVHDTLSLGTALGAVF